MLDNRLKTCADFVTGKGIAVDVGTDHAYLAAELVASGKCSRVIASDINPGPLESAARTVEKYGVSENVELVLSDGLQNVNMENVTDIIIAGMGGETIIHILQNGVILSGNIRLILQPMSKPELLRKWLYDHTFEIVSEKAVEADGKLYTVMCAENSFELHRLTEYESISGFFEEGDKLGTKYRRKEAERLAKAAEGLEKSGKTEDALHYSALSQRLLSGVEEMRIREIYSFLDEKYPFSDQEKWDNSGLLVENMSMSCSKVLLSLDVTSEAVFEARRKRADLIISHHPVIFDPLKKIGRNNPVFHLIHAGIAAICMHTNLDISMGGTNDVILKKLSEKLEIDGDPLPFEEIGMLKNLGWIIELKESIGCEELAEILKEIFGCSYVRTNSRNRKQLSKIAICSGSGGSMLGLAIEKNCSGMITGDVKHDVWIDANNQYITLFDCGHFHTENLVLRELRRVLEEKFPLLDVEIAESSVDPCVYI